LSVSSFLLCCVRLALVSPLFPYTTLFRSQLAVAGHVVSGLVSNVFAVAGHQLLTPDLASGCLPGITREALLQLAPSVGLTPVERSEEHTSELQSHLNLVCRLLLEKKKQIK